ncbi:hypothetical protein MIMGU_mgv1a017075mg [Erythranthe guttata]|uniref:PHD-type domain-containing protein n=1 Tax=Erythranthe guttata TaxID=4155 RepID=A0A022R811_ERYGU|nr:hypothetical protein MIMGU_mgv1a017075mg [Erythranthe guttata]
MTIPTSMWHSGKGQTQAVLPCDKSDAEYHTYCLRPPVASVRQGSWFCPCCAVDKNIDRDSPSTKTSIGQEQNKLKRDFINFCINYFLGIVRADN